MRGPSVPRTGGAAVPQGEQARRGAQHGVGGRVQLRAQLSIYAAGKAAVMSFTRSMSAEFVGHGIRVNAIAPGPVDTDMMRKNPQQAIDYMVSGTLMKRLASPDEMVGAALLLCSDAGSYITGTVVIVDGGRDAALTRWSAVRRGTFHDREFGATEVKPDGGPRPIRSVRSQGGVFEVSCRARPIASIPSRSDAMRALRRACRATRQGQALPRCPRFPARAALASRRRRRADRRGSVLRPERGPSRWCGTDMFAMRAFRCRRPRTAACCPFRGQHEVAPVEWLFDSRLSVLRGPRHLLVDGLAFPSIPLLYHPVSAGLSAAARRRPSGLDAQASEVEIRVGLADPPDDGLRGVPDPDRVVAPRIHSMAIRH